MSHDLILVPVGVLAGWTFLVLGLVPIARFGGVAKGRVKREDFKFGESSNVPGDISVPNRNYMNLLELPLLFYVLALMLYVTNTVTSLQLQLAWAYVATRVLHSLVHLTYNNVLHRPLVFAIGNFILLAMWGLFYFGGGLNVG